MAIRAITETSEVVVAKDVLGSAFADETIILNLADGVYYGLRDVGARLWQLVQKPVRVSVLCDTVTAEYDVGRDRCMHDLQALLADLAGRGLVEIRESRSA